MVKHRFRSQVGKLQRRLVKPDSLELTDQSKEETGLSVDELYKAEPLDKVLQQVRLIRLLVKIPVQALKHFKTHLESCPLLSCIPRLKYFKTDSKEKLKMLNKAFNLYDNGLTLTGKNIHSW